MKVTIDRFEGRYAVVQLPDGSMADMQRELVPSSAAGDVISIEIDEKATQAAKSKAEKLMDEVWND